MRDILAAGVHFMKRAADPAFWDQTSGLSIAGYQLSPQEQQMWNQRSSDPAWKQKAIEYIKMNKSPYAGRYKAQARTPADMNLPSGPAGGMPGLPPSPTNIGMPSMSQGGGAGSPSLAGGPSGSYPRLPRSPMAAGLPGQTQKADVLGPQLEQMRPGPSFAGPMQSAPPSYDALAKLTGGAMANSPANGAPRTPDWGRLGTSMAGMLGQGAVTGQFAPTENAISQYNKPRGPAFGQKALGALGQGSVGTGMKSFMGR